MATTFDEIASLFEDGPNETTAASQARAIQRCAPSLVLIADAEGKQVRSDFGEEPWDQRRLSRLATEISRRLAAVSACRFETDAGRVTLRGVVNTYFQKQMAQESLRHVDGVHEIANELEVCWM